MHGASSYLNGSIGDSVCLSNLTDGPPWMLKSLDFLPVFNMSVRQAGVMLPHDVMVKFVKRDFLGVRTQTLPFRLQVHSIFSPSFS